MDKFEGKLIKVKTEKSLFEGILSFFDKANGKITIESNSSKIEMFFDEILEISLIEEEPLKESEMYALFYESFNIYGPFEDQFVYSIASALKKFLRDMSTSSIKVIVDSDDVFGRIGMCFARILLGKVKQLSLEIRCDLFDLNSLKYKNSFINSGGSIDEIDMSKEEKSFSFILFACNRNSSFEKYSNISNQIILLDIPENPTFQSFTGLGLGFIPENRSMCTRSYYLIDVGFGSYLTKKYKLPQNLKNSLVKMDLNVK
jgi:hypothetical protein